MLPTEALEKLGDSIFPIESDNSKNSEKATEESANYTVKKINRLPCTHPACNKYGKPNHTNESCYIRHPDLCPDELKDKFQKKSRITKIIASLEISAVMKEVIARRKDPRAKTWEITSRKLT